MLEQRLSVLVVDDRPAMAEMVADGLLDHGFAARPVGGGPLALELLGRERFDALVTDLRMPGVDGFELLAASLRLDPARPVVVMTAYGAIDTAIESIRRGAYHYVVKPFKVEELALFLHRALDATRLREEASALEQALRDRGGHPTLLGSSRAMRELVGKVERLANAGAPVLLLGETGTGKGLVARALHAAGERAAEPFVAVNCAALPDALLESELFGHVRGAFTGATTSRAGLFAEARRGTLLLDEVGDLALGLQAKLLHVLEQSSVRPVGGDKERPVEARVLAATHRDLRERVRAGAFREDLLYRLDVLSLEVPPLRHRRDDIPELVEHFFRRFRARHPSSRAERLSPEALARLLDYGFPGNVRELAHLIERLVLLAGGPDITPADLPEALLASPAARPAPFAGPVRPMREVQRRYAAWAFEQSGGHRARTAEQLGIDVKTLSKLLGEGDGEASR